MFKNRGGRRKDTDAWANKGVLLNVLDLGFGRLEDLSNSPVLRQRPSQVSRLYRAGPPKKSG